MRYKCAGVNQADVNAELRARFGETCTRAEIMQYREESGIDPRWIRKGKACNIGRGLYRIPGGDSAAPAPVPAAVYRPKLARKSPNDGVRAVLPTPFDDGDYETPEPVQEAPVATTKRGRKAKSAEPVDKMAGITLDANGEMPLPLIVHAWVCTRNSEGCPGRKPGDYRPADESEPVCECGAPMERHAWARKKKSF